VLAFVAGLAFGVVAPITQFYVNNPQEQNTAGSYMVPVLSLEVYDPDGNLVKTHTKVGDPPTLNFVKIILQHNLWSKTTGNKELYNTTLVDIEGTEVIVSTATDGRTYTEATVNEVDKQVIKIMVGDGTDPFDPSQYNLTGTWIADVVMNKFISFYNSTHMWVVYEGTWTNDLGADKDITECGLFIYWTYSSTNENWFMLFRDTFSPITVPDGGALVIRYYIYVQYA